MDRQQEIFLLTRFLSMLSRGTLGLDGARALLERCGSISGMALSPPALLMRAGNLSSAQAELLSQLPQIVRRCRLDQCGDHPKLERLETAARYVRALYTGAQHEQLFMLCLDDGYRLIEARQLSSGSMLETSVPPRLIMESALRVQSGAVIFCHNHPAGRLFFSETDVSSTVAAIEILSKINVAVLDHLLVTRGQIVSLRRMHYIAESVWTNSGALAVPFSRWVEQTGSDDESSGGKA